MYLTYLSLEVVNMTTKILSTLTKESDTRTTCTLSIEGSIALECLTSDFGLKQKQIFDLIVSQDIYNYVNTVKSPSESAPSKRQNRKSLVITKKNLKLLNATSEASGLQRDVIVDRAFRYLVLILQKATELQKEQHQKAVEVLNRLSEHQLEVEKELAGYLDEDDAILTRVSKAICVLNNLIFEVENHIKNGSAIDPDGL
jgi:hypothetical protein